MSPTTTEPQSVEITTNLHQDKTVNIDDTKPPTASSSDVVFVIEATANLGTYFDVLKNHYIIPTIEHFCGYSFSDGNYSNGSDFAINNALFALVAYHTASSAPEPASICIGPTSSPQKILLWIESLKFVGGGAENLGQITEGMASALQVFDDFEFLHQKSYTTNNNDTDKSSLVGNNRNINNPTAITNTTTSSSTTNNSN